jgi:hypothetical protein
VDLEDPVPVVVAPLATPSASVAAPDARAARAGDPVCVAFTEAGGAFRHAGTRIVAVDLAPSLAAAMAQSAGDLLRVA